MKKTPPVLLIDESLMSVCAPKRNVHKNAVSETEKELYRFALEREEVFAGIRTSNE